jgi:hypothetical protein
MQVSKLQKGPDLGGVATAIPKETAANKVVVIAAQNPTRQAVILDCGSSFGLSITLSPQS